ncbi:glycosyltransferase [Clostridium sp.]|uniref:glycosyltransferase n=1 Tax=Clostridium sp. TaxID=1506 RepID=UPI003993314A
MKQKKIGILVPSLSDGGAEKVAANLSIIYDELGYDVYLLLYENRVTFDYKGKIIDLGIRRRSGVGKLLKDYEIYKKLKAIKKQYDFDIVISHLPKTDLMNCLTKKNDKVITTIHNNIDIDYPSYMKKLLPYIIKKSDLIASVSMIGENYLKNNYGAMNVKTLYNPQMTEDIINKSKETVEELSKEFFNGTVLINVGRLDTQKGQWHLIRAFKRVVEFDNNSKLIIVGRGPYEEKLKNLSKNLGLEKNIHFTGFNSNPYKFIKNSTIYVGTSLYEGFGMTLIEGMSLGLPIISTDCISGPREIIEPKRIDGTIEYGEELQYGILTKPFDSSEDLESLELSESEEELGRIIIKLIKDKELIDRLKEKSLKRCKDFDYKEIKKVWSKELKALVGES